MGRGDGIAAMDPPMTQAGTKEVNETKMMRIEKKKIREKNY